MLVSLFRPYNPNRDFSAALGDGEEDLDLLPPQDPKVEPSLMEVWFR